ncbi:hypothetical protein CsSME_00002112 [Camellia sinensis var. sinensis]
MPCTHIHIHPIVIVAMDPGPADPTVLTLQQSHRFSLAWTASDDVDSVILTC